MTNPKIFRTKTGRVRSAEDVDAIAEEVEREDYDVEALKPRRHGRPSIGAGPADVVPVRIDPELRAAIAARAEAEHTTASEIIREALRRFLNIA
jgi:predicted transcriptional regulator